MSPIILIGFSKRRVGARHPPNCKRTRALRTNRLPWPRAMVGEITHPTPPIPLPPHPATPTAPVGRASARHRRYRRDWRAEARPTTPCFHVVAGVPYPPIPLPSSPRSAYTPPSTPRPHTAPARCPTLPTAPPPP